MTDTAAGWIDRCRRAPGLCLFLFALLIRVVFVACAIDAGPDFVFSEDSQRYDRLALNLLHRQQFRAEPFELEELDLPPDFESTVVPRGHLTGSKFPDATHYDGPELKRVPFFTVFLGLVYAVFGYSPHAFLFVQALLGSLGCWLLYRIGLRLGRPGVGVLAGSLSALNPRTLVFVGMVQVETYWTALLLLLFLTMLRYLQSPTWRNTIGFALTLGAATFSREMGMYMFVLFLPGIVGPLLAGSHRRTGAAWARVALLVLLPLTIVGGWRARNNAHCGHYIWTSHMAFTEAWHFGPKVMAARWGMTESEARLRLSEELALRHPQYKRYRTALEQSPSSFWKFNNLVDLNLDAVEVVRPHLAENLPLVVSAFAGGAFWSLWGGVHDWNGLFMTAEEYDALGLRLTTREAKLALFRFELGRAWTIVSDFLGQLPFTVLMLFACIWLLTLVLYPSALIGLVPFWRSERLITLELVGIVLFAGAVAGPAGNSRLFVFAHPFISLLSAQGLFTLGAWWRARRGQRRTASEAA